MILIGDQDTMGGRRGTCIQGSTAKSTLDMKTWHSQIEKEVVFNGDL